MLPLVFFTLSVGKQPRYILPVLPPLALLLASSIIERTSDWRSLDGARRRPRPNRAVVFGCVSGGLFLVRSPGCSTARSRCSSTSPTLNTIIVAGVIAVGGARGRRGQLHAARGASGPGMLAVAAAITFAVLPYGALAASADAAVVQMAEHVRGARTDGEAIGTYRVFVRNLVFYTGVKHTDIIHDEHLKDWLTKHRRAGAC